MAITSPMFTNVLDQELEQVETSRTLRLGKNNSRPAARDSLIGLAFSGGGIRSATFNLGILQALAQERLLRAFDYISTVSGGGYIGGWLMAWMHHQKIGIQAVEERISAAPDAGQSADPPEVHFLRDYSNYLTPRKGLLSTDSWAFIAGYLRNTLLNQAILVLALLFLLLTPRTIVHLFHMLEDLEESIPPGAPMQYLMQSQYFALALGLLLAVTGVFFIGWNLVSVDQEPSETVPGTTNKMRRFTSSFAVQVCIVLPLLFSAAFFAYGLGESLAAWHVIDHSWYSGPILGSILYLALWAVALAVRAILSAPLQTSDADTPRTWVILLSAAPTGFITGFLFDLIPFERVLVPTAAEFKIWRAITSGTPLLVGMMLITGVLHIGLMGREMIDKHREWWGRLGGLLMFYAACWLVLFAIAIYFPSSLQNFLSAHKGLTFSGVIVWVASTAYGVFFGKSEHSGLAVLDASNRQKLWHYLARITPYIFILGLLLGLSLLASLFCAWITGQGETPFSFPGDVNFDWRVPLAWGLLLLAAFALSWRVDINEFSTHYLYRNRLIRCYLGASRLTRDPQPFTGFSDLDNFALKELEIPLESNDPKNARPLPLVNTSLNVVRGKELALQTRKARSFAFTPLYGGFTRQLPGSREWENFFGSTKEAGCHRRAFRDGMTLGTSIAISGAAASPSMGSYSEPALAFLMTLFDVRLGWWIGNPTSKWWKRGSPVFGFGRLLAELLGNTNDESDFVYLSDGGHFENLAIYELARRRCKLIVACDASCDQSFNLTDLHNAMEHCRTDLGVTITLDDDSLLKPTDSPEGLRAKSHFVKGTIRYPDSAPGTIIYVKPTLVEGDPEDVLAYNRVNPHFPHDTTANQWFDETHFENYRVLGEAAGEAAVDAIKDAIKRLIDYAAGGSLQSKGTAA